MFINLIQKLAGFPFVFRQSRIAKTRPPLNEGEFVDLISNSGGDRGAASILYSKLIDWVYADHFTPYPEDSLSHLYGIAEEELDEDLILDILKQLGIPPPGREEVIKFGRVDSPLRVAQLVSFARKD